MPNSTATTHRAPSGRSLPSDAWTLDLIRTAEASAIQGQLRWAAELCDVLWGDDRVQSARKKLGGLFGLPLTFEEGVGRRRKSAARALEAEDDWWAAFSDESLLDLLMWALTLGVALGQIIWKRQGKRLVPKLKVWHPRALRFEEQTERWIVRTGEGLDVPITIGDGSWVIFTPNAEVAPWCHGAWRPISRWWRAKTYALDDWGRHSEQAAGLKVAETEGSNDADRNALVQDLTDTGSDAAVVMPAGWKLSQLDVAAGAVDVFDRLIDAGDDAITIALLGQNLTTEVSGGSYAAASVHQVVAEHVLRALASSLSNTLHEQVLKPWAAFNFGSAEAAPWPIWDVDPPKDQKLAVEVGKSKVEIAERLETKGVLVDWDALAEECDIPVRAKPTRPELPATGSTNPATDVN